MASNKEDLRWTRYCDNEPETGSEAGPPSAGSSLAKEPDEHEDRFEEDPESDLDDDYVRLGAMSKAQYRRPGFQTTSLYSLGRTSFQSVSKGKSFPLNSTTILFQVEDDDVYEVALAFRKQHWKRSARRLFRGFPADMDVVFTDTILQTESHLGRVLEFSDGVRWMISFPADGTQLTEEVRRRMDHECKASTRPQGS